jgi:hypothetical protein
MWRTAAVASLAGTALALATPAAMEDRPRRAAAEPPPRPDGLLVLAVNPPERALLADPITGRTKERELPGGTLCHGPLLAAGDRIVFVGSRGGHFVALSAPLGRPGRARSLGATDTITPSATPGRIWLGRWSARRLSLREVDAGGRVLARARIRPAHFETLAADVGGAFLTTSGPGLSLRSPQRERPWVRIRDGWVVAADAERFAWCREPCRRLHIWSRGGESVFDHPAAIRPWLGPVGAFSPDGKRLALPVAADGGSRLGVIDLQRGAWSVVRGGRLGGYAAIAWSPSGRWLYFGGRGHRVLASRDGIERAVRLPIRPGGTVMSIAANTPGSAGR